MATNSGKNMAIKMGNVERMEYVNIFQTTFSKFYVIGRGS